VYDYVVCLDDLSLRFYLATVRCVVDCRVILNYWNTDNVSLVFKYWMKDYKYIFSEIEMNIISFLFRTVVFCSANLKKLQKRIKKITEDDF
jgi:hypothetical protein